MYVGKRPLNQPFKIVVKYLVRARCCCSWHKFKTAPISTLRTLAEGRSKSPVSAKAGIPDFNLLYGYLSKPVIKF